MSFVHQHPLKLQPRAATLRRERCDICDKNLQQGTETYVCDFVGCEDYQVHKSCAHLPLRIQHLLHPCPLFLLAVDDGSTCDACFTSDKYGLLYSCKECKFNLDVRCAKKVPTREELNSSDGGHRKILHFSHGHSLTLISPTPKEFDSNHNEICLCKICGETCLVLDDDDGTFFGCAQCKFYLHGTCLGMLPQKIQHPSHRCSLILYAPLAMMRDESFGPDNLALMFRCGRCEFNLCMSCWLSPVASSDRGKLGRSTVQSFKIPAKDCGVCGRLCLPPSPNKATTKCGSSQRPGSLAPYIHHVSHPPRVLPLVNLAEKGILSVRCHLCRGECHDVAFLCFQEECPLCLHPECASLAPTVVSPQHRHPLTVVDNIYDDQVKCSSCHASCSNAAALRCQAPNCSFSIHIWCGPLPSFIKQHKCHVHPLILKNYLVNEDDEDDAENSFCCHVCEQPRDPRLGVYHCVDGCHMICEVQCVVSEVVASLRGQRGDVNLRIAGNPLQRACKISTCIDLLIEMNLQVLLRYGDLGTQGEEGTQTRFPQLSFRQILRGAGYYNDREEPNYVHSYDSPVEGNKGLDPLDASNFVLSEESFTQLIRRLESHDFTDDAVPDELMSSFFEIGLETISEGHQSSLINTFRYYPAITERIIKGHFFDDKVLALAVAFGGTVLDSMIRTKVADVTEEKLREWWVYLNWLKQGGCDVQFMFDHLTRVARAYLCLRAKNQVVEQQRELDQIAKEMEKLRMRAEVLEKQQNACLKSIWARTEFSKKCLKDARSLRWKPAVAGLEGVRLDLLDSDGEHLPQGKE